MIGSISHYARPTAGPPGMPAALLENLRQAYAAAPADPELLSEGKQASLSIEPASGEEVEKAVAKVWSQSPDVTAALLDSIGAMKRKPVT